MERSFFSHSSSINRPKNDLQSGVGDRIGEEGGGERKDGIKFFTINVSLPETGTLRDLIRAFTSKEKVCGKWWGERERVRG